MLSFCGLLGEKGFKQLARIEIQRFWVGDRETMAFNQDDLTRSKVTKGLKGLKVPLTILGQSLTFVQKEKRKPAPGMK